MSCPFFVSNYIQRLDKNNANTLSIIGATLSIIGPLSGNLRIALGHIKKIISFSSSWLRNLNAAGGNLILSIYCASYIV